MDRLWNDLSIENIKENVEALNSATIPVKSNLFSKKKEFLDANFKGKFFKELSTPCKTPFERIQMVITSHQSLDNKQKNAEIEEIVVHIHGGGFVSGRATTCEVFTRVWAKDT